MDRRALDGGITALVAEDLEDRGFLVAFVERAGGVSGPPYDTLNVGFRTGDRPERVRANRRRVAAALGVPPFAVARQVHGARVAMVDGAARGAGFDGPDTPLGRADALATRGAGVPLAVLVADCVPVAVASADEGTLVAVHVGWRGLATGVVGEALRTFRRRAGVAAAVGPAIGPCHYEVGEDVAAAVAGGHPAGAVVEPRGGRVYLDLPATVTAVLSAEGVERVEAAGACTACHPERFFSHRRDRTTGRQAMVAMRR